MVSGVLTVHLNDRFKWPAASSTTSAASLTLMMMGGAHAHGSRWRGKGRYSPRRQRHSLEHENKVPRSPLPTASWGRQVTEDSARWWVGQLHQSTANRAGTTELDDKDVEYMDCAHTTSRRTTFGLRGSARRSHVGNRRFHSRIPSLPASVIPGPGYYIWGQHRVPGGTPGTPTGTSGAPTGRFRRNPLTGGTLDGGSVEQQVRRYDITVDPYIEYLLSERTTLQLDYIYSSLNYDNAGNTGLEDSQTNAVRLEVRREVSERDTARIRMGAAHMDPDVSSAVMPIR